MTERDRKVLAIVIAVVVLGGFWFLVVHKKQAQIKEANAAQVAAQAELTAAQTAETNALKVAKVKPAAYSRLLRLGKAIPVDEDFQSLLVQINDISVDSEVSFISLTASKGQGGAQGATGTTTCDAPTGASGAATPATPAPASPATGPTGVTGSTAETWVGKSRDKAKNAAAAEDGANAATEAASKALECANSPTLTDIAAKAAGLGVESYAFTFTGSFYNLKDVYNGILDLVKVHNGRVGVTGRLLDINSISMTVSNFPQLNASVQMTGYQLPDVTASNGTQLDATATTPAPGSAQGAAASANAAAAPPSQ